MLVNFYSSLAGNRQIAVLPELDASERAVAAAKVIPETVRRTENGNVGASVAVIIAAD